MTPNLQYSAFSDLSQFATTRSKQIIEQTRIDQNLQVLVKTIAEGWPDHRYECNTAILKFWNHRDELTYMDGVILKGDWIIILETLQNDILNQLHASHLGMVKTKERARMVVFWPNITKDIENMIGSFSTCCSMAQHQGKESMMTSQILTHPYEHVGTDIFEFMGVQYLVTTDYYSRFKEVDKLTTSTSQQVITKLKAHFTRHGIPENTDVRQRDSVLVKGIQRFRRTHGTWPTKLQAQTIHSQMDLSKKRYRRQKGSCLKL